MVGHSPGRIKDNGTNGPGTRAKNRQCELWKGRIYQQFSYWCLAGNGWEWENGIVINSCYGSFPHSLLSISKIWRCAKWLVMFGKSENTDDKTWDVCFNSWDRLIKKWYNSDTYYTNRIIYLVKPHIYIYDVCNRSSCNVFNFEHLMLKPTHVWLPTSAIQQP